VEILAKHTSNEIDKNKLTHLSDGVVYTPAIVEHRISVLDLLETYPSIELPFASFLSMLPSLKPRHYSISSSPLANPGVCTLTYSIIDAPSLSGLPDRFQAVAGTYLQTLGPGDPIQVGVRSTNRIFRPPTNPENTPLVMFCAGSGLAPFRGFVQERAELISEGKRKLAPALLFVGCRAPDNDRLYADEFDHWTKLGAVEVYYAYSRAPESSCGCKYVQHRILHEKDRVGALWRSGAKIYTCGSRDVATEIGLAAKTLVKERMEAIGTPFTDKQVDQWLEEKKNERFVSDIFS
jgi:cytochrome P450/NADPH-cytochrome P450 reductase